MNTVRKVKIGIVYLIAVILIFGSFGCSKDTGVKTPDEATGTVSQAKSTENEAVAEPGKAAYDPFGKYEPSIKLTTVFRDDNRTYPKGQTWDNNVWTQAYEERLGIKLEYLWAASTEYENKVNMAIATNDLPDIMAVNYNQFYKMAKAGLLADITEAYENYISEECRFGFESYNGLYKGMDTVDGKLYGIGRTLKPEPFTIFAYRNDWLENLGLQAPQTTDDIINFMYAAAKGDPNKNSKKAYGLPIHKNVFGAVDLTGFFNMYDAHPRVWVEKDGKLVYGGIQPEVREALRKLNQMYNDGVINPEFGIIGPWDRMMDEFVDNVYGAGFVPKWWTDARGSQIAVNTGGKGTWSFIPIPSINGGVAKGDFTASQTDVVCMKKGTKYPEAMIKMINLHLKLKYEEPEPYHLLHEDGVDIPTHQYVIGNIYLEEFYLGDDINTRIAKAIEKKDPSSLDEVNRMAYEKAMKYLEGGDLNEYGFYGVFGPGGSYETLDKAIKADGVYLNRYYGPNTDTMNQKMGGISSKQLETFTKIIMEGNVDKEFDTWISFWNSQGGEEITAEVNEWHNSRK